jgi:hypothetical protein
MSFISKLQANPVMVFVLEAANIGLKRAIGSKNCRSKEKVQNIQCVKLNKDHVPLVQVVTQWCNQRSDKLKELGVTKESLAAMNRRDANFLTSLASAIAGAGQPDAEYDYWLFFNTDTQSTNYFELQQCDRGSKTMRCSQVILGDR